MRNVSKQVVEKIKTHILCPGTAFFFVCFENRDVYETMWKQGRPQMTIWRTRIACWIPKATNTHSEHLKLTDLPLPLLLH